MVFLGIIGSLMFVESVRAIRRARANPEALPTPAPAARLDRRAALQDALVFRTSGSYISVIPPLLVGFFVGVLAAII